MVSGGSTGGIPVFHQYIGHNQKKDVRLSKPAAMAGKDTVLLTDRPQAVRTSGFKNIPTFKHRCRAEGNLPRQQRRMVLCACRQQCHQPLFSEISFAFWHRDLPPGRIGLDSVGYGQAAGRGMPSIGSAPGVD